MDCSMNTIFRQDIYQLEIMTNLDQLPAKSALSSQLAFPSWHQASSSEGLLFTIKKKSLRVFIFQAPYLYNN